MINNKKILTKNKKNIFNVYFELKTVKNFIILNRPQFQVNPRTVAYLFGSLGKNPRGGTCDSKC